MQGIDTNIVLWFQHIRCEVLTHFFSVFIPLELWILVTAGLVIWFLLRSGALRIPIVSLFLANALAFYFCQILKFYIHRPRPFLSVTGAAPLIALTSFSFPSAHATFSMAMAVVLAYHFPKAHRLLYGLALVVGVSRVYLGAHYPSDVLAGFVLGGVLGWLSIRMERAIVVVTDGIVLFNKGKVK